MDQRGTTHRIAYTSLPHSSERVPHKLKSALLRACSFLLLLAFATHGSWGQNCAYRVPILLNPTVPDHVVPDSGNFQLTVNGNFGFGSDLRWNGTLLDSQPVSATQMTATIPAAFVKGAQTAAVTAGWKSDPLYFAVSEPHTIGKWQRIDHTFGTQPEQLAVADLNGDGILDIVSVDGPNNVVEVFLGLGRGSFAKPVTYSVGNNPLGIILADVNGDTYPDIVTANYGTNFGASPGSVSVLLNNQNGTFQAHLDDQVGRGPIALAAADFDCIGVRGLAVLNSWDNSIILYRAGCSGVFYCKEGPFPTGNYPVAMAIGDFNRDGSPDIAVANFGAGTISILMGDGQDDFYPKVDYPADSGPTSIIAADVDGDGILDLVTANKCGHAAQCGNPGTVSIFHGKGDGTFSPAANYSAGNYPYTVTAADFTSDGTLQLAVTNWNSGLISFLSRRQGSWKVFSTVPTNGKPVGMSTGDFNNDGKLDLVVGGDSPAGFSLMLQQ